MMPLCIIKRLPNNQWAQREPVRMAIRMLAILMLIRVFFS